MKTPDIKPVHNMKYSFTHGGMALLLLISLQYAKAQSQVDFGSNKGKYAVINERKIYYEEYGKGTPLFMFHGGLSSIRGLGTLIPELARSYRVIAIDAPGNGRSEQSDSVSFRLMADYYSKMIDALKLDSVYVYGFSLGGITALHLAADRPDKVKMTVAHSITNHLKGYNEGFAGTPEMTPEVVEQYAKWWIDGHLKRTPQPGQWRKFIRDLQRVWIPNEFITDAKLRSIRGKVLILQGDKDLVRIEHAVHIRNLIHDSQMGILPNTTHFSLAENPEDVLYAIKPFFARQQRISAALEY